MPLDSRQKRASALGFWNPSGPLPLADGGNADTKAKRAMLLFQYSALTPTIGAVIRSTIDLIGRYSTTVGDLIGRNSPSFVSAFIGRYSTDVDLEGKV